MTALLDQPEVLAAPGTYPVPPGRGRWRVTLHQRSFVSGTSWQSTLISELPHAAGRQLTQVWNQPAQFVFTIDGHHSEAALVQELQHEIVAWRWDDTTGADVPLFRGVIGQSEDQIDDRHTVTFTAHDYAAMLSRRPTQYAYNTVNADQDNLVLNFLTMATTFQPSYGGTLQPGAWFPLVQTYVNPDGSTRGASGRLRTRQYPAQSDTFQMLADLAAVIGGFDFDVLPFGCPDHATDAFRVFYPQQGVTRTDTVLNFGGNVATVQRQVSSDDYANYVRVVGMSTTAGVQLFGETYNADASGVVVGTWALADNAADVKDQPTLNDKAAADLNYYGILLPSYTVTLRPGVWFQGFANMGDVVPLVVKSGRLNVTGTPVRVVGITYDVGDDGDENVSLVLGRPVRKLSAIFKASDRDVDALVRR